MAKYVTPTGLESTLALLPEETRPVWPVPKLHTPRVHTTPEEGEKRLHATLRLDGSN